MVRLHIKTADDRNQFVFETETSASVKDLIETLVEIHTFRIKTEKLAQATRSLANYGPMRSETTRGLSDQVMEISGLKAEENCANPDPEFQRTGITPPRNLAEIMMKAADEADQVLQSTSPINASNGDKVTSSTRLHCAFQNICSAIAIAYPDNNGLPEYDITREIIDNKYCGNPANISERINKENATLWWAGKQLDPQLILSKYIGTNEKTKVIMRLQPKTAGAPTREPRMDENTHKAILEMCYKKQREKQELEDDDDDSYLNSQWANPKNLKNELHGFGSNVSWSY